MRHALLCLLALLAGCEGLTEVGHPADDDSAADAGFIITDDGGILIPPDAGQVLACQTGRLYQGFGGRELTLTRAQLEANSERARIKPFEALAGGAGHESDYARVLGTANPPAVLPAMRATFFAAVDRWYEEPRPGAINLYGAYRAAYQGCKNTTASGAAFASAPTAATAASQCTTWQTRFWRRVPLQAELDACVTLATTGTAGVSDARTRWAITCAGVLTSAGFLTY